jgi:hypothetical protein
MNLVCRNCSRVNPPDAQYCYYDGVVLDGHTAGGGPIAVGVQPFLNPFVFPSGRQCRNFDELVLACYGEWKEAQELLHQGYLESFFGGLGRADLALAARRSARADDQDLALDQLLTKLPSSAREPPKLFAQPLEVSLGQLARGEDRTFELHIENQGMGLLQGTVSCDNTTNWLVLGEGGGSPSKVFQCLHDFRLPVKVHGKALRAGNKPLEGQLTIESNGGTTTVVIRAEVPVRPFPEGALAGAISPRQVAEKAKTNPRGAAPFFENGAVAAWYDTNGWTYPVQGPPSSGLGAIQQFFEALGLVRPPLVDISERSVQFQGASGATLEHVLQVQAQEKRPVFAHATTGAPWLKIGRIVLEGRTARIPLKVPQVPDRPGEKLEGKVQVTSNGNQRFLVDVALTISAEPRLEIPARPTPVRSNVRGEKPGEEPDLATIQVLPVDTMTAAPGAVALPLPSPQKQAPPPVTTEGGGSGFLIHLLPVALVTLLLVSVLIHDLIVLLRAESAAAPAAAVPEPVVIDPNPYIAIRFHEGGDKEMPQPTMRFGLVMLREKDPTHPNQLKRLTFDEKGRSNNTCLRVDGDDYLFGQPAGVWVNRRAPLADVDGQSRDGLASVWQLPAKKIVVTQEVEVVPGPQSRRLDTCLVRYVVENKGGKSHKAGIRFMLDTFIGANDGVPFTIPGEAGLCDTRHQFRTAAEVPDFIQALEKDDPRQPGTVAYLQFRVGSQIESPNRVLLGGWPNSELKQPGARAQLTLWEVPYISIKEKVGRQVANDSAVTMYWDSRPLGPGQRRTVGFTYGLGDVHGEESAGHLLLTVGGRLVRHGEFTLTVLVHNPQSGEKLTLTLPEGFAFIGGEAEQEVPPVPRGATRRDSPVTWRIRAGEDGAYDLTVQSNKGVREKLSIVIRTRGVFD